MPRRNLVSLPLVVIAVVGCGSGDDGGVPAFCYETRDLLTTSADADEFIMKSDGNSLYYAAKELNLVRVPAGGGTPTVLGSEPCAFSLGIVAGYMYWVSCAPDTIYPILQTSIAGGTTATVATGSDAWFETNQRAVYWVETDAAIREALHSNPTESTVIINTSPSAYIVNMHASDKNLCWEEGSNGGSGPLLSCIDLDRRSEPAASIAITSDPDNPSVLWTFAVADGTVYWVQECGRGNCLRSSSTQGGPATELARGMPILTDLFVRGDRLYWEQNAGDGGGDFDAYSMLLDGGLPTPLARDVDAFTVDQCHLYSFVRDGEDEALYREPLVF